jgi:hypothetical protein
MKNMQDNYFDQLIRTKLQSYEVPEGPSDWDALADRLDANFDAAIAEKLSTASVAYDPADWDAMEASMPHPFDMAIAAKLGGLTYSAFDANWNQMDARLDADFDAEMRESMGQLELQPAAGDWEAMASMLDASQPIAWYQRLAPVGDALLMVLLAALLWGPQPDASSSMLHADDSQLPLPLTITQSTQTETSGSREVEAFITEEAELAISSEANASIPSVPSTPIASIASEEASQASVSQPVIYAQAQAKQEKPSLDADQQEEVTITGLRSAEALTKAEPTCRFTGPIEAHDINSTSALAPPAAPLPLIGKENTFNIPSLRIGTTVSVISSAAEFNDKGLGGYLAGIRLELPISNKLSIISGLQVGEKHFDRMQFNELIDNSSANRQRTYWVSRMQGNIQMLEIPLFIRYRFSTDKRVNLYFQGGFAPSITLNEEYLHYDPRSAENLSQTQAMSNIDFTKAKDNPALEAYLESLQPNADVHTLNTYVGFLQMAPGLDIKVANNFSLQLEPYIQLGLQRIGSERQSLHSLGGSFSIMYHFPQK